MKIQKRTMCKVSSAKNTDGELLTVVFNNGPIQYIVICNIPQENRQEASAYVKIKLIPSTTEWTEYDD
jgi:hypothetical protein